MRPRHVTERKSRKKFQLLILHHFKEKFSLAVVPYPGARLNHGSRTLTILPYRYMYLKKACYLKTYIDDNSSIDLEKLHQIKN